MYEDKTLTCRECGNEFVFSASEQEFFAQKGFQNEPSRCPACRAARRAQNGNGGRRRSPPDVQSDLRRMRLRNRSSLPAPRRSARVLP